VSHSNRWRCLAVREYARHDFPRYRSSLVSDAEKPSDTGVGVPLRPAIELAEKPSREPAAARSTSPPITRSIVSAGVYSLGFAVQRAIGIVMLPLYTRAISPSEYGDLGILLSIFAVASVLFSVGLEPWIVRSYFHSAADPKRRQDQIDSVWRFLVIYPLIASLALAAAVWPFLGSGKSISGLDFSLMLFASAVNTTATTLPLAVLRARQDLRGYLWITGITALGTPAVTAVLVVVLHGGVRGWFLALLLVNLAALVTAMFVMPWRPQRHINWRIVRGGVLFSLPLIPHFISSWALQLADRLVIAGIVSSAQLGIYSLASNLGSPILMLVQALNQGFIPSYAKAGAESGHENELYNVVTLQITAVVGLTLAGAMLGMSAVSLLTPHSYHSAAPLVPWIVLGYGFVGVYYVPMSGATVGAGRRNFAWVASAASAATNIALLVLFVPRYGVHAAAVASAIGYLVLLVLMVIWAHARNNPVKYDWLQIGPVILLGVLAYVGATFTAPQGPLAAIGVQLAWLLAFASAVVVLRLRSRVIKRLRPFAR
jgi:O-antigen/teichoic acid export membrane protein